MRRILTTFLVKDLTPVLVVWFVIIVLVNLLRLM